MELRIILPEVAAAQRSSWDSVVVDTDAPPEPARAWEFGLAVGERVARRVGVRIERPGYYQVIATLRKRSAEPEVRGGALVQDLASARLWLWIDERGGRVTEAFDPGVFTPELRVQGGPRTRTSERARMRAPAGAHVLCTTPGLCPTLDRVTLRLRYANHNTDTQDPVPGAAARVELRDATSNAVFRSYELRTGTTGQVGLLCERDPDGDWARYSVTFESSGPDVEVKGAFVGGAAYAPMLASTSGTMATDCGASGYDVAAWSDEQAHAFVTMNRTVAASRALLGRARGRIPVLLASGAANSVYYPAADEITLRAGATPTSHVFGTFGTFTLAHEYGHAVQHKALGGIPSSIACPSPHFLNGASNLGCAYAEGFADFHAVATLGAYRNALEFNDYYPGCVYDAQGTCVAAASDGSTIEGAVAAFLYDLVDAPSEWEPFDQTAFPGSYVADVLRTCEVGTFGIVWSRATGIDHLSYCFERAVDPGVTGSATFFASRGADPTSTRESATEPAGWNRTSIRRSWVRNLYGQTWSGTVPPPPGDDPSCTPSGGLPCPV